MYLFPDKDLVDTKMEFYSRNCLVVNFAGWGRAIW